MRCTFYQTLAATALYALSGLDEVSASLSQSNAHVDFEDYMLERTLAQLDTGDLTKAEAKWLAQLEAEGAFDDSDEELELGQVDAESSSASSSSSGSSSSSSSDSDAQVGVEAVSDKELAQINADIESEEYAEPPMMNFAQLYAADPEDLSEEHRMMLAQVDIEAVAQRNIEYFSSYLDALGVDGAEVLAQLETTHDKNELQALVTDPDVYQQLAQLHAHVNGDSDGEEDI